MTEIQIIANIQALLEASKSDDEMKAIDALANLAQVALLDLHRAADALEAIAANDSARLARNK